MNPNPNPPAPAAHDDAVVIDGVGKRFEIYPNDRSRFFELIGSRTHHTDHWALRDLSFRVPRGRAFGVIGANGAGKSTLLRVLAGISEPTEGSVSVHGRIATLLDLGVGFQSTFTGRENIRLACALLGMTDAETEARIPDIIRFAELGEFIDHPARTYSTGMNLRLGFAIAVHADADVLIVDEVLAVGDQYFQRKCIRQVEALLAGGTTLVLVSHDLHAVRSLCDEALWLDRGRARQIGPPREVVEAYLELDRVRAAPSRPSTPPVVRPDGTAPSVTALGAGGFPPPATPPGRVAGGGLSSPPGPLAPGSADDSAVTAVVTQACALPDAAERFRAHAGDAPRAMDGDVPVVAGTGEARILCVRMLAADGSERERFTTGEPLVVAVTFRTTEPLPRPIFGVALFRSDGVYVFGPNTRFDGVLEGTYHGVYTFWVHYPELPLLAGTYRVSVAIFDQGHVSAHVWHNQLYGFEVVQGVEDHGIVRIPHQWGMVAHHVAEEG